MEGTWGLLGPEFLPNTRRTRGLGLGALVRRFNDLAVPGLGGVWYGKQLLLATLGVAVAERARSQGAKVQNIEVANAIEALACWLAFKNNGWNSDARLSGRVKLNGKTDFSFQRARQRGFYVTQPMRMTTVQALPALGFVESSSERFNAFACSNEGMEFVETAFGKYRPFNRPVLEHLVRWVQAKDDRVDTSALQEALSPLVPLSSEAIPLLRERLTQGGSESNDDRIRRHAVLTWVDDLRKGRRAKQTWELRPQAISQDHWRDLHAGALFFEARDAAIAVLDATEVHIGNQGSGLFLSLKQPTPESLSRPIEKLEAAAQKYLLQFESLDRDASRFCRECVTGDSVSILRALVNRDGRVLRLVGDDIRPGPAFRGSTVLPSSDDDDQTVPQVEDIELPRGISGRVQNLYLLNLDMHGELGDWLDARNQG